MIKSTSEKGIDQDLVYSTAVIAKILGVRPNTITRYPVTPLFKEGNKDFYDIREVLRHVYREERKELMDLTHEKAKLTNLHSQKLKVQMAILKKDLLDASEVEALWVDFASNCRQKLLAVPSRASDQILGCTSKDEVIQVLKTHIADALSELKELSREDFSLKEGALSSDEPIKDDAFE